MAKGEIVKAEVVSVRRATKVYGRDCSQHYVLRIGLKNPATGDTHYADLPLIFTAGLDWAFYDKDKKVSVSRKLTTKDTADAVEHARRVFPDWAKFVDALPADAAPSQAFGWFDANADTGITVDAAFSERGYTDAGGVAKTAYDATMYEQFEAALPDDFDATFAKTLRASNVKLGKAAKVAAAAVAALPPAPVAPTATTATQGSGDAPPTQADAWNAYIRGVHGKEDPAGADFWNEVKRATGKNPNNLAAFTADDWRLCVKDFGLPF